MPADMQKSDYSWLYLRYFWLLFAYSAWYLVNNAPIRKLKHLKSYGFLIYFAKKIESSFTLEHSADCHTFLSQIKPAGF
jgi:hypothetical protein